MMGEMHSEWTGRLAISAGIVAAGCAVSLATFFAVGGPFGTINDYGNAIAGILGGALAWRLRSRLAGRARGVALGLALVGAAITVVGSAMVVSGTTGFFLAGLVSSAGFAGIGGWLVLYNRSDARDGGQLRRLRSVGLAAGAVMAAGIVMVPAIIAGYDDMATVPGWVWIGSIGWLGVYVLYPVWAIGIGVVELGGARQRAASVDRGALPEAEAPSWTRG
jgi:hypothetical protein